jgi:hypothetical protein
MRGGGRGAVAGTQPMSTAVHKNPNKLWGFNSICNLHVCASHIERRRTQREIKKGGAGLEPNNTTSEIIMGLFKTKFPLGFAAFFLSFPSSFRWYNRISGVVVLEVKEAELFLKDCRR